MKTKEARKNCGDQMRDLATIASGMEYRSDGEVRRSLEELSRRERKITLEILLHLIEVEKRKIFASAGYGSLFNYCTRGIGYSESAAGRRIRAARCIRDYPEVLALLSAGEVTICSVSAIAGILDRGNCRAILKEIRGKSKREIDRIVAEAKPLSAIRERVRPVSIRRREPGAETKSGSGSRPESERKESKDTPPDQLHLSTNKRPDSDRHRGGQELTAPAVTQRFKIEFAADKEFVKKMEQIRSRLSGRYPKGVSMEKLFGLLMDEFLEKNESGKRAERRKNRATKRGKQTERKEKRANDQGRQSDRVQSEKPAVTGTTRSRYIPADIRDLIHIRDSGRCGWIAPDGTRCGSTWDLEIDHIKPFALGGDHMPDNLRLLCACHNRLEAEVRFGPPRENLE